MEVVSAQVVKDKNVLLRLDIDVPIKQTTDNSQQLTVTEDFRLLAGLETLKLCLENALTVNIIGHIGRPEGNNPNLSVAPIADWYKQKLAGLVYKARLNVLENLRFEKGEEECSIDFAGNLISLTGADYYINEAFASHHKSASTTVLPTLLPHAAGLRFYKEVEELTQVREHPLRPLVVIIGGAKIEDKLPAVKKMSQVADAVLVGGKLIEEIKRSNEYGFLGPTIVVGKLTEDGEDITPETVENWASIIKGAKQVLWNGPVGKVEDPKNGNSLKLAQAIINSGAKSILGGGDTIAFLNANNMLSKFTFVSTGGGAMLKFLEEGTLETIQVLN